MSTSSTPPNEASSDVSAPEAAPPIVETTGEAADPGKPAAILRGSARGLEIVVDSCAGTPAIAAAVTRRLAEAPGFFRGSDVRIRVEDGPLPAGCLAKLDAIVSELEMRIVEVGAAKKPDLSAPTHASGGVPSIDLAAGSAAASAPAPSSSIAALEPSAPTIEIIHAEATPSAPVAAAPAEVIPVVEAPSTRTVLGPVRSGVILEHRGNVVIFGDVNPGAEVRAEGNIVVLGRLRGTAHAGIGRDNAFILALRLEPQQLRISRSVARASETDKPGSVPEIAHITGGAITVENYSGRLPRNLAESI
ncbi:MAG TPA: septum site-determining protein MinC [Kofleriaceae bacterium]|nr:septum site-determining protein MinC [Kofleriaceae bacterium]